MTDKKWFKGNGFLTEEGERALIDFSYGLETVIARDEVRNMSMGELHALQANLAKKVGDAVSAHIARRMQESASLSEMSDNEVDEYLTDKYGTIWPELTLSPEECVRVQSFRNKKRK